MLTLKNINNNYTLNTNYLLQSIAELESQQTPNIISTPVAQQQQEAAPKTTTTKTTKTPKKAAKATLSTSYKSVTTQHGYFIPSTLETEVVSTTYNTILSINVLTKGYTLGCEINGVQQTSVGDIYYTNWLLKELQPNDTVIFTLIGGKTDQVITYTVHKNGVTTDAPEGIKGTHSIIPDTQDKYRKAAQQTVEAAAPVQTEEKDASIEVAPMAQEEAPAQIEEQAVEAPVLAEGQVLTFGKHAGKLLSDCETSYLKWLVAHESRLHENNRWACTAAKAILATRQAQQQVA